MKTAKLDYSANEINALLAKIKNDVYTKDEQIQHITLPPEESYTFSVIAKVLSNKYVTSYDKAYTFFVNKMYIVLYSHAYNSIYSITFIELSGTKYALMYNNEYYFDIQNADYTDYANMKIVDMSIHVREQELDSEHFNYMFGKEISQNGDTFSLNYMPIIDSSESQKYGKLNTSLALIALREASMYLLTNFKDTSQHQLIRKYFMLSYYGFSGTKNFAIVFVRDYNGLRYDSNNISTSLIQLTHADLIIYDLENNVHIKLQTDYQPRTLSDITVDDISDGYSSTSAAYIIAKPLYVTELEKVSYNGSIEFVNGYSNKSAYINIYREGKNLSIIIAGQLNINQNSFVVEAVQTPLEFTLDEETSRKLFVGDSNTAAGNIAALPGLYYNDQNYQTTVVPFIIRRKEENGNVYQLRFTGSQLASSSTLTDLNFRLTLALD